jgi:hypothetical protein
VSDVHIWSNWNAAHSGGTIVRVLTPKVLVSLIGIGVQDHRRKGLAHLVLEKLVGLWCQCDWRCAPFAYSVCDNEASHTALKAAGFHKHNDYCWFAIRRDA